MKNPVYRKLMAAATVIVITLGCALPASAQNASASSPSASKGLSIVPVLGVTSFDLAGMKQDSANPIGSTSMRSGLLIGALVEYPVGWWSSRLEAGLVYMETGSEIDLWIAGIETSISYIGIPVNYRVPLFSVYDTSIHVKGGITPIYLIDAKEKGIGFTEHDENIKDQLNSFDVIAQFGFGGEYSLGSGMDLLLDIAYMRGLREVYKEAGGRNEGYTIVTGLSVEL